MKLICFSIIILSVHGFLASRAINPTCARDNCLRSVIASNIAGGNARGSSDCASFFRTTITPCTSTSTVAATTTMTAPTSTTTSTVTVVVTATATSTSTATITSTGSTQVDTLTSTSTTQTTLIITSVITTTPGIAGNVAKRAGTLMKRATGQTTCMPSSSVATMVPTYASGCSGTVRYSSACSCNGVTSAVVTAPTPVITTTSTTTLTSTPIATATTTTTSTTSVTTIVTTTSTMTVATTTAITTTVTTTDIVTITTFTTTAAPVQSPPPRPSCVEISDANGAVVGYIMNSLSAENEVLYSTVKSSAAQFLVTSGGSLDKPPSGTLIYNLNGQPQNSGVYDGKTLGCGRAGDQDYGSTFRCRLGPYLVNTGTEAKSDPSGGYYQSALWKLDAPSGALVPYWKSSGGEIDRIPCQLLTVQRDEVNSFDCNARATNNLASFKLVPW